MSVGWTKVLLSRSATTGLRHQLLRVDRPSPLLARVPSTVTRDVGTRGLAYRSDDATVEVIEQVIVDYAPGVRQTIEHEQSRRRFWQRSIKRWCSCTWSTLAR